MHGWAIAGLCLAALACGETKYTCPSGYKLNGKNCYPIEQVQPPTDTGGAPDVIFPQDLGQLDAPALDEASPPDTSENDVLAPQDLKPDTKDVKVPAKKSVGAVCIDDADCVSGVLTCYSWPGGYCSATTCKAGGVVCPGASTCWNSGTVDLCVATCDDNPDCRTTEGYGCKRLSQDFGGLDARFCLPGGKSGLGMGCKAALDCTGSATCLTDMAGGYCARLGCGATDPCDAGSACVMRNGKPTCLKTCETNTDCEITKPPRKCVAKTDMTKKAVNVCLDSAKAAPVGAACAVDLDCETKLCVIYAKGTCQGNGLPCLGDGQCGSAAPCVLDAAAEKGSCGSPCSADKGCPVNSVCVPGAGSTQAGSCQPICKGPGDEGAGATCTAPGTKCVFGDPVAPPAGSATPSYSCAAQATGSSGASCTAATECTSGTCQTNEAGNDGYCANECGPTVPCNFGSACVNTGLAVGNCWKRCSGNYDCPIQMACVQSSDANAKVCMTP